MYMGEGHPLDPDAPDQGKRDEAIRFHTNPIAGELRLVEYSDTKHISLADAEITFEVVPFVWTVWRRG